MTDNDVAEMKQKIAEYDYLTEQKLAYSKLIDELSNTSSYANLRFEVSTQLCAVQLRKCQAEKLIGLLTEFKEDLNKEINEL